MINNKIEYVVCAAIWYDDGVEHKENACPGVNTGVVITGHRHYNCISLMPTGMEYLKDFPERNLLKMDDFTSVQGFMTSKGRFVDRKEGMKLAFIAGQVNIQRAVEERDGDTEFWETIDYRTRCWGEEDMGEGLRIAIAIHVKEWKKLYSEDLY